MGELTTAAQEHSATMAAENAAVSEMMDHIASDNGNFTTYDSAVSARSDISEDAQAGSNLMRSIANHEMFGGDDQKIAGIMYQTVYDGVKLGVDEYARINLGDKPNANQVIGALAQVKSMLDVANEPSQKDSTTGAGETSFSFSGHDAGGIITTSIKILMQNAIASSKGLVTFLANPKGENKLPIVATELVAQNSVGGTRAGDKLDGISCGSVFVSNKHEVIVSEVSAGSSTFKETFKHAYKKEDLPNGIIVEVFDADAVDAPVYQNHNRVMIAGNIVATDEGVKTAHKSTTYKLIIVKDELEVGNKTYKMLSATIDRNDNTIVIEFENSIGYDLPERGDLTVAFAYNYEHRTNGIQTLIEPATDMTFAEYALIANPMRAKTTISKESIGQIRNELGIDFFSAVMITYINKNAFEMSSWCLRKAFRFCAYNRDTNFLLKDANLGNANVMFNTIAEVMSIINIAIKSAKKTLAINLDIDIEAVDVYISGVGYDYFGAMNSTQFTHTNASVGTNKSIPLIGRTTGGDNVYYVPNTVGIFNESAGKMQMLLIPRHAEDVKNAFLGHIPQPIMPTKNSEAAFSEYGGVHGSICYQTNPIEEYENQYILVEFINMPKM